MWILYLAMFRLSHDRGIRPFKTEKRLGSIFNPTLCLLLFEIKNLVCLVVKIWSKFQSRFNIIFENVCSLCMKVEVIDKKAWSNKKVWLSSKNCLKKLFCIIFGSFVKRNFSRINLIEIYFCVNQNNTKFHRFSYAIEQMKRNKVSIKRGTQGK